MAGMRRPFDWLRYNFLIVISLYACEIFGSILVSVRCYNRSELLLF